VALAFVGLTYSLARAYISTTMSEPLGLFWGLFCVIFFVEALRRHAHAHALIALLALAIGLLTRMGAMITLPFIALWISYGFATSLTARLRLFVAACLIVLAGLALNSALAFLYSNPGAATGSNFAFTVCGLALGGDWSLCAAKYAAELKLLNEQSQARLLIEMAWGNFLHHPQVVLRQLLHNGAQFLRDFPGWMLAGTGDHSQSRTLYLLLAIWALLPGLIFALRWRSKRIERAFWLALWTSVILSAAVVYGDGGWRGLYITNALLALFAGLGFSAPASVVTTLRDRWIVRPRNAVAFVTAMMSLFVVVPGVSRALDRIDLPSESAQQPGPNVHLVAGGRWPTGFLVIADKTARPAWAPSMHYSDFFAMVRRLGLESETGAFVESALARLPFAFMTAPDIDIRGSTAIFIAPPEVLQRRNVEAWRFAVVHVRPNSILMIVESAEPVEPH
jgi:hypothetical protein